MQSGDDNFLKLRSALGFAMKAGKVRSGELAADRTLKSGKACLVVIDSAASIAAKKRWSDACSHYSVELIELNGMGSAIGREAHMVACITDNGFAQMILRARRDIES